MGSAKSRPGITKLSNAGRKIKKQQYFVRGRREEKRCAGVEKEDWLCCRISKILSESIHLKIKHAAPKAAADLKATASAADPLWELLLVEFVSSASIASIVSTVGRSMNRPSSECNPRSVCYIC